MLMGAVKCVPMIALTIGIGYGMCVVAEKQKGVLKTVGNVLGLVILIVSIGLAALCVGKLGCKKNMYEKMHSGSGCNMVNMVSGKSCGFKK